MRSFMIVALILMTGLITEQGQAQVNFGVSVGDRNGFYLEIGNYYRVPQREVMMIHDRDIDDEDISVVFFIADAAGVPPVVVADLRRDGWSWREIAFHFRLDPQIFYVPAYGSPFEYGRYRSYRDWRRIDMRDDDFIRFANVRFIAEHYRWNPAEIMRMRAHRRNFFMIHNDIRREAHRDFNRENNGNHNGWKQREYHREYDREYNRDDNHNRGDNRETPRQNDERTRRHGRERE